MRSDKTILLLSLVLATMACTLLTSAPGAAATTPAVETTTARPHDSATPIDLHVGQGVRGPWFELYFTDPSNPAARQYSGGVDERLVAAIDSARLKIHLAMYNLNLNNVRDALVRAHRRGVEVRLVTESDNLDGRDLQRLIEAGIPVLGDRREGTMHNKFMVIDGLEVWTGSMNYTGSGVYEDNNCLIRIFSDQIAGAYEAEFAEMFDDDLFGDQGASPATPPAIKVSGTPIEVLFAPDDRPEAVLIGLLDSALTKVEFLAFSFTSDPLSEALMRVYDARLELRGVMDAEQASSNVGTEWTAFRSAGLDVRLDGAPGQMHEKVFIIDDEVVVMGSYNFSRSANEYNDENLLIIHSALVARQFSRQFAQIYDVAAP